MSFCLIYTLNEHLAVERELGAVGREFWGVGNTIYIIVRSVVQVPCVGFLA